MIHLAAPQDASVKDDINSLSARFAAFEKRVFENQMKILVEL